MSHPQNENTPSPRPTMERKERPAKRKKIPNPSQSGLPAPQKLKDNTSHPIPVQSAQQHMDSFEASIPDGCEHELTINPTTIRFWREWPSKRDEYPSYIAGAKSGISNHIFPLLSKRLYGDTIQEIDVELVFGVSLADLDFVVKAIDLFASLQRLTFLELWLTPCEPTAQLSTFLVFHVNIVRSRAAVPLF